MIRLLARTALASACFMAGLFATPPLTTVRDVLYKADGTRFNGTAMIAWNTFQAADLTTIPAQSITLRIVDGNVNVQLIPTTNASLGAYYTVRYTTNAGQQFLERWSVPPSTTAVKLSAVRMTGTLPPGGVINPPVVTQVQINDVSGLSWELTNRPARGTLFTASRAAIINANGGLDGAAGNPADCVKVDGSSGPCGSGGVGLAFVDGEAPAGVLNGSNAVFTLAAAPAPVASLMLFRNGILLRSGVDYALTGSTVTFQPGAIPQSGDLVQAFYRTTL